MEWLAASELPSLKGINKMDAQKIIGSFPCKKVNH